jgi:hypothetical protein
MTEIISGRARRYRGFLGTGFGSGLLAGVCCVGSALAVGAGISGLSFFTTWMNRYQVYGLVRGGRQQDGWHLAPGGQLSASGPRVRPVETDAAEDRGQWNGDEEEGASGGAGRTWAGVARSRRGCRGAAAWRGRAAAW